MRRQQISLVGQGIGLGCALAWRDLGEGDDLRLAHFSLVEAALQNGRLLRRGGVGGHITDAQTVVLKNLEPALALNDVVFTFSTPADH